MTIREEVEQLCLGAKEASRTLALADTEARNRILYRLADLLEENHLRVLAENERDLSAAEGNGVPRAMMDRLALNNERIFAMAQSLRQVALLEDPVGKEESWSRPSGLLIRRVRVPLGVVAIIYEARPNVTVDSAALCLKTGNAVVLRGGKEAICTNMVLAELIRSRIETLTEIPEKIAFFLQLL